MILLNNYMRLPFELTESKFKPDARVKFVYTSSELHQNIEISMDGNNTTVETLLEGFERFLGALGICTPPNVVLGFIELNDEDEENNEDENEEND